MRSIILLFILSVLVVVVVAGRRGDLSRRPPIEVFPDMDRQPKLRPQTGNALFPDRLSSQPAVPGTVARGSAYEDSPYNTGKVPGTTNWVELAPVEFTAELLARGQERFNIYCAVCHGAAGDGKGITTKPLYTMVGVANFHDPRLVRMTDGQIFNTITYGSPAQLMLGYGGSIPIPDRWAIVAYLRALQRARLATLDDVPAEVRPALTKPLPPGAVGTATTP
jgi:mono/diheme cytochrome c family protein